MDMKEIYRRIKKGVRNISISPLFEKGKLYSLDTQKEDISGTLRPSSTHCWVTWESQWIDDEGRKHWGKEAFNVSSLEEAEKVKVYLEKHLI